jgi:hypothetical protein
MVRMPIISHLHTSMPHVKKLADLFVLLPIFPLTSPGTVQGGLACRAAQELDILRCYGATDDAALGHDCCWIEVGVFSVRNVYKSNAGIV